MTYAINLAIHALAYGGGIIAAAAIFSTIRAALPAIRRLRDDYHML